MRLAIYSILLYFPLVFIYKLFGDPLNNYWINAYWLMVSIDYIFILIGVRKACNEISVLNNKTRKTYRSIALMAAIYWGVMAAIRLYLFFNIEKHAELISSAGKLTIGCVSVIVILIYLTAQTWRQK